MDKAILEQQIKEAIGAHGMWKVKLATAVNTGKLPKPAADIATDNQCAFGKWLYKIQADPAVARSAQFRSVLAAHARFHHEAGRVAHLIELGQADVAARELEGAAFKSASRKLVDDMADWKRSV